jgi:hypothetical protein
MFAYLFHARKRIHVNSTMTVNHTKYNTPVEIFLSLLVQLFPKVRRVIYTKKLFDDGKIILKLVRTFSNPSQAFF